MPNKLIFYLKCILTLEFYFRIYFEFVFDSKNGWLIALIALTRNSSNGRGVVTRARCHCDPQ
jgi:hypothetical protein